MKIPHCSAAPPPPAGREGGGKILGYLLPACAAIVQCLAGILSYVYCVYLYRQRAFRVRDGAASGNLRAACRWRT